MWVYVCDSFHPSVFSLCDLKHTNLLIDWPDTTFLQPRNVPSWLYSTWPKFHRNPWLLNSPRICFRDVFQDVFCCLSQLSHEDSIFSQPESHKKLQTIYFCKTRNNREVFTFRPPVKSVRSFRQVYMWLLIVFYVCTKLKASGLNILPDARHT